MSAATQQPTLTIAAGDRVRIAAHARAAYPSPYRERAGVAVSVSEHRTTKVRRWLVDYAAVPGGYGRCPVREEHLERDEAGLTGMVPMFSIGERVKVRPSASGEKPPDRLLYQIGHIAGPGRYSRGHTFWPVQFELYVVAVPISGRFLFGEGGES